MKTLKDILYKAGIEEIIGSTQVQVASIHFDSRTVSANSLFVAVPGTKTNGHKFIEQAIFSGASSVVCEKFPEKIDEKTTYIKVKNSSEALGFIVANFYDCPSEKIKLVGITGTNGKTTVATLLYHLFLALGHRAGLISTIQNKIGNEEIPATHTTPDSLQLNKLLAAMVAAGCRFCFMEVSSHAVVQNRIAGLKFSGAIFTNITHDHLDYHKTFDEYLLAKKKFFAHLPKDAFALVNQDDAYGREMLMNTNAEKKNYALHSASDFKCKVIENQFSGLLLNIDGTEMWSKLIGSFNAYNLLAVYAAAVLLGENKLKVLTALSNMNAVEGRFQYVRSANGTTGIVDYAHTPDALKNVLRTIHDIRTGTERIITVTGCGGDRDAFKRPVMARIACEESDKVIFTSDNPRSENPDEIIKQMIAGIEHKMQKKVLCITDRREAIKTACSLALAGDIILVAGKGHEKYQEIGGVKYPFDDMKVLKENLNLFAGTNNG